MGRKANEPIGSSYCHGLGGNQVFAYTKRHQIMSDDNCLDAAHPRGPVKLVRCHGMQGNQEWKYDEEVSAMEVDAIRGAFRSIWMNSESLMLTRSIFYFLYAGKNHKARKFR